MSNIRKLMQEKFGYTTNLPSISDMHKDVTDRNGRDGKNPAYLPVEEFRKVIKHLMGATTTEEDGQVEDALDFTALHRLANKHGFAPEFLKSLNTIQLEVAKPKAKRDRKTIIAEWEKIKDTVPFWFLGLLPNHKNEELPEEDKKLLTNLKDMMDEFNKNSEKEGKAAAKDTEHAGRDTEAKKNLDKARKDADIKDDAGKDLGKKPENEVK
jgi:hypothetical protein